MSAWVHAGQLYITDEGMSRVIERNLFIALRDDPTLTEALATGLQFFFASRNLTTSSRVMMRYAEHITQEYKSALEKSLASGDQAMFEDAHVSDQTFFGIAQGDAPVR